MSGIFDLITGLVSGIGGLFSGGLTQLLNQLTDNVVTLGLLLFAVGLGVFAIVYLNRRRQTLDTQRLAALITSLHRSGVAHDLLTQPTAEDARDHLLRGLRWLFGAVGLSSALYGYASMQPTATADAALGGALIGLLPGMLGLAHLLFSWLLRRRATPVAMARPAVGARAAIMRATVRPPARQALRPFRAAVRRF